MITIGDIVTVVIDITREIVIQGIVVSIGRHVVIVELANGEREAANRLNVKRIKAGR